MADEKAKAEAMHNSDKPNHHDKLNPKGTAPSTKPC